MIIITTSMKLKPSFFNKWLKFQNKNTNYAKSAIPCVGARLKCGKPTPTATFTARKKPSVHKKMNQMNGYVITSVNSLFLYHVCNLLFLVVPKVQTLCHFFVLLCLCFASNDIDRCESFVIFKRRTLSYLTCFDHFEIIYLHPFVVC